MRNILIIFFILITFFISANDFLITEVSSPDELKGCGFFPLYKGLKWTWEVKENSELITNQTWEIVSAYIINNSKINVVNVLGFLIAVKDNKNKIIDQFYVFEYDGYICYLKEKNGRIERIVPINPTLEDQWMNGDDIYNVAELEENMLKIEFINGDASKYGYMKFVKDEGPYQIFEYETTGDLNKDIDMKVIENIAYSDINKESKEEIVKIDEKEKEIKEEEKIEEDKDVIKDEDKVTEKEEDKIVVEEKEDDTVIEEEKDEVVINEEDKIIEEDYIDKLSKNKKYIQIGAFNIISYAKILLIKAKDNGYTAKLLHDTDGYYKVLVEFTGNEKDVITKIRKTIAPDAFVKQR